MLTDDCWLVVFKSFSLIDEITLLQVSKQFKRVIQSMWQSKYKRVIFNLAKMDLDAQEFKVFMENVCETVEVLNLESLTGDWFEILKECRFPMTQVFCFSQVKPFTMTNSDIQTMTQIFPNLRAFCPEGNFDGNFMSRFEYLRNLTLRYCTHIKFYHLYDILRPQRLKSLTLATFVKEVDPLYDSFTGFCKLEAIVVNAHELTWLLSEVFVTNSQMKNLVVTNRFQNHHVAYLFWLLKTYKAKELYSLQMNTLQADANIFALNHFQNLRKLTFVDHYGILRHIVQYVKVMPALRELIFVKCLVFKHKELFGLLRECTQLDFLSFEECTFEFLHLILDIPYLLELRHKRIHFNFYRNINNLDTPNEMPDFIDFELYGRSRMFHFTTKKLTRDPSEVLNCTFRSN